MHPESKSAIEWYALSRRNQLGWESLEYQKEGTRDQVRSESSLLEAAKRARGPNVQVFQRGEPRGNARNLRTIWERNWGSNRKCGMKIDAWENAGLGRVSRSSWNQLWVADWRFRMRSARTHLPQIFRTAEWFEKHLVTFFSPVHSFQRYEVSSL